MKVILNYLLILLVCASAMANAQTTSFINYGMEQGLIQNQVECITQDDNGNLWIGTIAGLTKYNGSEFKNYTKNNGLAEDWITTSYKDKNGNLWFGHWAGNVTRYNTKNGIFENLGLEEYTHFKSIRSILEDTDGKFWIATEGSGVFIYDPVKDNMFTLKSKDGLLSNTVYDIEFDSKNNLWIATDSGLVFYDRKLQISNPASFEQFTYRDGLHSKNITSIFYNEVYEEIWVGSADNGIGVYPLKQKSSNKSWLNNKHTYTNLNGLGSSFIKTIQADQKGNVWIGTVGGGVSRVIVSPGTNRKEQLTNAIFKTYSTRQGLNYFNVNSIFEDREQNIWIATDLGLNEFRGELMQTFDEADSIPNNIVWSTLADKEGNIWLGTNNGLSKMSFYKTADGKTSYHKQSIYRTESGFNSTTIISLFEDSKGNIWAGTGFDGVYKLTKGAKTFVNYNSSKGLASDMVYSIAEDAEGNIWLGTKDGASKLNPQSGEIRNYNTSDGLGGNQIYRIFKDSKGILWIGALGGHLTMYDGSSFKKFDETNGLKHRFILCINEDNKGIIWFGCYGGGLYSYDGKTFVNYDKEFGLTSESPYSIIADKDNNIWIGNDKGIDKFDRKRNKIIHYGKKEGFLGVECNPNSITLDKNNCIWFGTIMGAIKFNPTEEIPNTTAPIVKITGLKLHLKDTIFPFDAVFKYNQNNITFKFVGVCLTNPEKVKYEYTLEGFDKGWIPASYLTREAIYTNLPSGDYVFKVKACNNDGIWSQPATYAFSVKPPFWQTALFYIFVVVFVVFAIFVFDRVRTAKLKKEKAALEAKVAERTQELALKNNELAEKNKDITDSIRYAKRIQQSSLTSEKEFNVHLSDNFILFKPKDIVSGDFFWYHHEGDVVYVAAIDCTGHGVPGAILSIIANNLLEETISFTGLAAPSAVLNELSKRASKALHSSMEEIQLRDGMDIALCKIDFKQKMIEFSGAYNSLYLIRENKLVEYPADHHSIGNLEGNFSYTNHQFQIESNDKVYLFSDGFADQFGGDRGKKYKYNRFQELLVKINNHSLLEQREILDREFETWKGSLEQVDDVLVIGIKLE